MDDAVPRLPRLMLSCLMVAIMAIALVGTAWHGTARAGTPAPLVHSASGGHQHVGQHQGGHKHAAPGQAHAAAQGCCHPACTVAVIPCPAGTTRADRLSTSLRLSRNLVPAPAAPSGLDRPPKRA